MEKEDKKERGDKLTAKQQFILYLSLIFGAWSYFLTVSILSMVR